jgi:hypothetical protein
MLQDLNASPTAIARKHVRWRSRAKQMLRKMPPEKIAGMFADEASPPQHT